MDKGKNLNYITWLRALGVILILLCHIVQESSTILIKNSAQLFNVGVELFFIISGFCLGIQGEILDYKKWYQKRFKRIYISFELFLLLLFVIYILTNSQINIIKWICAIFAVNVQIKGATHTWFVSVIIICYIITPLFSKFCCSTPQKCLYPILITFAVISGFIPVTIISNYLPHVFYYLIFYIYGKNYKEKKEKTFFNAWGYFIIIAVSVVFRLISRKLLDDSLLYNNVIVIATQYIIGLSIFKIFESFFHDKKPLNLVDFLCKISYEEYLVHYILIVGPISLMHITENWFVNVLAVFSVSVICATVLNYCSSIIQNNRRLI